MILTKEQIKKRYFDKIYNSAQYVLCKCGCAQLTKERDHYGRKKEYINGHNGRKYIDPTEYKREWNHRNRRQRKIYKKKRVHKFKSELIIILGGKCSCCGLPFDGECTSIFDFHHKDPTIKLFNINNASLSKKNKSQILLEVNKCELLCANCHRMLHWDWKDITTVMENQKDLVNIVVELTPLAVIKG